MKNIVLKSILPFILFLLPTNTFAQELLPTSSTGQIIKHTYYTLSYSEANEQAEWVYYVLTPDFINGNEKRKDNFKKDPLVSTGSAELKDYKGSGYDRGHLMPAADMKLNLTSMSESFYMSNMSPQLPSFNRGIWKKLEAKVRNWALIEGKIHVVTAGVLTTNKGSIGENEVSVPEQYYKVIYDPTGDKKMIAFILPNEKSSQPLMDFVVSTDYVESITGIDFFPDLDDDVEDELERSSNGALWEFK